MGLIVWRLSNHNLLCRMCLMCRSVCHPLWQTGLSAAMHIMNSTGRSVIGKICISLWRWQAGCRPNWVVMVLDEQAMCLRDAFQQQSREYHLAALDAYEALITQMEMASVGLTGEAASQWQRDRMLLLMAAPLRNKIRANFSSDFSAPPL